MKNELSNKGIFSDLSSFEIAVRASQMLSRSSFIPEAFRGDEGACLLALNLSNHLGIDILTVVQNVYPIKGKLSLSGSFCIALIKRVFKNTHFEFNANRSACRFCATLDDGKVIYGTWITQEMIQQEGWNKNTKWQTMPEQMLKYRSASFFARTECPDAIFGLQTEDEIIDTQISTDLEPKLIKRQCAKVIENNEPSKEDLISKVKLIQGFDEKIVCKHASLKFSRDIDSLESMTCEELSIINMLMKTKAKK